MATYKMKSAQKGVLSGQVHPVAFEVGKTYEIDDELADQFKTLDAVEASSEEPVQALLVDETSTDHVNWLDTDPAVLRHGELTAQQVIARDESPMSDGMHVVEQPEGKAEGDVDAKTEAADGAKPDDQADGDDADGKTGKSKKSKA